MRKLQFSDSLTLRLMLVDDESAFLNTTKYSIQKQYPNIEVVTIGEVEDIDSDHFISAGSNALEYLKKVERGEFPLVHCIVIDSNMQGMNGLELLRNIKARDSFAPVVLLTGADNAMAAASVHSFEDGARGFLFKTSQSFFAELRITVCRIYVETTRERWLSALSDVGKIQLPDIRNVVEYAECVMEICKDHFPGTIGFLRKVHPDGKLELLGSFGVSDRHQKMLKFLQPEDFPFVKDALRLKQPRFDNEAYKWSKDKIGRVDDFDLHLDRAFFIPLVFENDVLGSISFYREKSQGFFLKEEEQYANTFAELLSAILFRTEHKKRFRKHLATISELTVSLNSLESEKAICKHIVDFISKDVEKNKYESDYLNLSKTTVKIVPVGTENLELIYHIGIPRKEDTNVGFKVRQSGSGVSGWVAATGISRIVKNYSSEKEWISTNDQICSSITTPLIDEGGSVLAVLNSECMIESFYDLNDLNYQEAISYIGGFFLSRLRARSFLLKVLDLVSVREYDSQVILEKLLENIKLFTGYRTIIVAIKSKSGVHFPIIEGYLEDDKQRIFDKVNNPDDDIPLVLQSINKGEEFSWSVSNFNSNVTVWFPSEKSKEEIKSQYVIPFKLKSGEAYGAFSLEFGVNNGLSNKQLESIRQVLPLVTKLLIETEEFMALEEEAHALRVKAGFYKAFKQIAHTLKNTSFQVGALTKQLLETEQLSDAGVERLSKIRVKTMELDKLKQNLRALTVDTERKLINVYQVLSKSLSFIDVKLSFHSVIILNNVDKNLMVYCDDKVLDMVFMNLIDNSVEALLGNPKENRIVQIWNEDLKNHSMVFVEDNGHDLQGLSKEEIFMENKTTSGHGTGVGLPFSRECLERIGGELTYTDSKYLSGAGFKILLPK